MNARRDFIVQATALTDPGEADALWTRLQEQGLEADAGNVRNVALERGWPPSKAEDLSRAVAAAQQTTPEEEPEPEPEPKPKSGNGRRKKVEPLVEDPAEEK